jgi:tRNA uridine 5-carboxymethylaminomethyl modification enzyme
LDLLRTARIDNAPATENLRRPDVSWSQFAEKCPVARNISADVGRQIEIRIKYEGYITRQDRQIERFAKTEAKLIPTWVDYSQVIGLRNEAKQKLTKFTPRSLGQALRISGITPADVTLLAIHMDRNRAGIS